MEKTIDKKPRTLILKILFLLIGIPVFMFLTLKLALYLAPFLIALIISTLMEPLIKLIMKKTKISRRIAAGITMLFVISIIGFLISFLISNVKQEIVSLYYYLPRHNTEIYNNINIFSNKLTQFYIGLPSEITDNIGKIVSSISTEVTNVLSSFLKGTLNVAVNIPQALIFIIVSLLATFFLSSDREKVREYLKSTIPDSWVLRIRNLKNDMFSALLGYIRAELIMMSITFTELCMGLWIIGIPYFLILAFLISIVDALPILGTGTFLIPWAIYRLVTGDIRMGVSLLILYIIVLTVRQLTEPKLISQQIGIHPLLTLMAMYLGLKLFGFVGLIFGPITVLLLKNILSGIIKKGTIKEALSRLKSPLDDN